MIEATIICVFGFLWDGPYIEVSNRKGGVMWLRPQVTVDVHHFYVLAKLPGKTHSSNYVYVNIVLH